MPYIRNWSEKYNPVKKDAQGSTVLSPDEPTRPVAPPESSTEPTPEVLPAVSVYFAPGKDPEKNIMGFIQRTKESLDIALFSFTSQRILRTLVDAIQRRVNVRIILDDAQAGMKISVYPELKPILGDKLIKDKSNYQQHSKYAISDGKAVITGSYNWSLKAEKNYENLLILRDPAVVKTYQDNFHSLWQSNF